MKTVLGRQLVAIPAVLALGASLAFAMLAPAASATPPVTLTGTAPAVTHGPSTITYTYTIVTPSDIGATVLTTHEPAALTALTAGVEVDHVAVPAGQVSRTDTVNIAIQTGATATDGLTAGTHTISFSAAVPAGAALATTSTATLAFTSAGSPLSVTSADVPVSLNEPDIAVETLLPPDSSPASLGTGREGGVIVAIANLGYGVPLGTATITLPPHVQLGPDGASRTGRLQLGRDPGDLCDGVRESDGTELPARDSAPC